jgi:hypothetical protein
MRLCQNQKQETSSTNIKNQVQKAPSSDKKTNVQIYVGQWIS